MSSVLDQARTDSLDSLEAGIIWEHCFSVLGDVAAIAFCASVSSVTCSSQHFDVLKAPLSFVEAVAHFDAPTRQSAMDQEKDSLDEMGAFEEADLPAGEHAIGLKWVFAHKTDSEGISIQGKKKAWVVVQGFNQRPSQYDKTYAPVAKMMSVRILLTWAAVQDLKIYQFDCKTAFLHMKIRHLVYTCQIPGYPLSDLKKVLRILVALYGLHQSAFEFYTLISSLLISLGMLRCKVDHGVFIGEWVSAPDLSVSMPADGCPLVLYVPLHVNDGLAVTNSPSLYAWFLQTLAKHLHIVDLGHCSKFLSILIIRDRPNHQLWLFSHVYVTELLDKWSLSSCKSASTPFSSNVVDLPPAPANLLLAITDMDLVPKYQCLVGCLLYLTIATQPDIAYYVMWLGQFNAMPSRSHFLATTHVLRNLSGTHLWLYVWVLLHILLCLPYVATCRTLVVLMLIGHRTQSTGRASLVILSILKVPWSLGQCEAGAYSFILDGGRILCNDSCL